MNLDRRLVEENQHAFLSPSKYHWINYDIDKLERAYLNYMAAQRGTELHEFAKDSIRLGINLPRSKKTLNMYVNDAIGFRMKPEQPLYFSPNCFGTTDTLSFRNNFVRIHDLKTGVSPASMRQLEIYLALFCLQNDIKPSDIDYELRIYQSDEIITHRPSVEDIAYIIEKIMVFDKKIEKIKTEV